MHVHLSLRGHWIIVQYKLIFEQLEHITQVLIQSMRCKNHVMVPDMQFGTQYMNQICKGIIGRKTEGFEEGKLLYRNGTW